MTLAHASASVGKPCAGCSKVSTYNDYNAHGIPIAAQSRQGHASSFLKHSYYAHRSYSAPRWTDPQPSHSPHHNCHSPARLCRSLAAAALLFFSPTAPCVTTMMRTRLLVCGCLSSQPKNGWCGSVDIIPGHDDEPAASGHESTCIRPLRPSREQLLHSRQRLVLLKPPTSSLSSATKSVIYSCQCGLGRHALIFHL
jgi:hypothetical protein